MNNNTFNYKPTYTNNLKNSTSRSPSNSSYLKSNTKLTKLNTSNSSLRVSERKNLQSSFSSTDSNKIRTLNKVSNLTTSNNENWKEKFYQISKDNESLKANMVKERQQNLDLSKKVRQMEKSISENEMLNNKLNKLADNFERISEDFKQSEIIRREQANLIKSLQKEVEILRERNFRDENMNESLNKINPDYYEKEDRERETRDNILDPEKPKTKKKIKLKTGKSKSKSKEKCVKTKITTSSSKKLTNK